MDSDIVCILNVNSISVGTFSRRFYIQELYMDVLTTIEPEMKLGAVLNF